MRLDFQRRTLRRATLLGLAPLVALLLSAALAPPSVGAQQTPREIVDEVDRLLRGESSRGLVTLEIVTENWSRALEIRVWSLGTDYALARVLSPAKEAGTATLKIDQEVWNYLPRVDRTIKVPPSLMMGSWMGSHFTNDDLVKESRLIEDYDVEIAFEGARDGVQVWEFALTPLPEAPVVWGRIDMQVRKRDRMPTWARYYDERGRLERTVTLGDYRVMGGRLVPARMDVVPADEPAERTTMLYTELEFDVGLTPDFFSLRNLRAREGR